MALIASYRDTCVLLRRLLWMASPIGHEYKCRYARIWSVWCIRVELHWKVVWKSYDIHFVNQAHCSTKANTWTAAWTFWTKNDNKTTFNCLIALFILEAWKSNVLEVPIQIRKLVTLITTTHKTSFSRENDCFTSFLIFAVKNSLQMHGTQDLSLKHPSLKMYVPA